MDRTAANGLPASFEGVRRRSGQGGFCRRPKGKRGVVGVGRSIKMRGAGGGGGGDQGGKLPGFATVPAGGGTKPGYGVPVAGSAEEPAADRGGGKMADQSITREKGGNARSGISPVECRIVADPKWSTRKVGTGMEAREISSGRAVKVSFNGSVGAGVVGS